MASRANHSLTPTHFSQYTATTTSIPVNIGFMVDADDTLTCSLRGDGGTEVDIVVKAGVQYSGDIATWTKSGGIGKLTVLHKTGTGE